MGQKGMTLVEVTAALVILVVLVLFTIIEIRRDLTVRARSRQAEAGTQVEEAVRRHLIQTLQNYYRTASPNCLQTAFPFLPRLTGQTPNGVTYVNLAVPAAQGLMRNPAANEPSLPKFNSAMQRCQRASTVGMPNNYFVTRAGVYFCLQFGMNPAIYQGTQNDMLGSMGPVVGEFFYTNVQNYVGGAVPNGEVRCPFLRPLLTAVPSVPTYGILYYTIYWQPRVTPQGNGTDRIYNSATGMVVAGNG